MSEKNNIINVIPTQDQFTTEKINVVNNGLLGEYVGESYIISPSIANELIMCKKIKKATFRNSVFSSCFMPNYGEIVFETVYEKNTSNNTAKATIFVLENEYKVNGYIQNTIKTALTAYVDDLDGFIEKTYKQFNISLGEGDSGKEYKVAEDPNLSGYIAAKKQFSLNLNKLTEDKYMAIYRDFFEERLNLLKSLNNDFSKSVLDKFNLEYQKIEKYFLQNKDYKALSELLDKCFEDMYGINPKLKDQEKEYREKILPVIITFSQKADKIFEKASSKAMDNLNTNDKQKAKEIQHEIEEAKKKKETPKKEKVEELTTSSESPKNKNILDELNKIKKDLSNLKPISNNKPEPKTESKAMKEIIGHVESKEFARPTAIASKEEPKPYIEKEPRKDKSTSKQREDDDSPEINSM